VAQQKHLRVNNENCFIDLVFYNYMLKCFVLVDLKVDQPMARDADRIDEYVRAFDEQQSQEVDNLTIGLTMYSESDTAFAMYSQLDKAQMIDCKYLAVMPSEAELKEELVRVRVLIEMNKE